MRNEQAELKASSVRAGIKSPEDLVRGSCKAAIVTSEDDSMLYTPNDAFNFKPGSRVECNRYRGFFTATMVKSS
ncbi:MAG TPA: hypothetical protein ENF42_00485 [Candidatus Bathyarchaeota archaeon]|nr:hypothetical protein [Candidatus Bathyarchaeota archaeon]